MITWVIFLAIGILIGVAAGLYFSRLDDAAKRTQDTLSKQLEQKDSELAEYKEQVKSHFVTTADLINNMTESYRAVHDHLSTGVSDLCKEGPSMLSVPFEERKILAEDPAEAGIESKNEVSDPADNEVKAEAADNTDTSDSSPAQPYAVAEDTQQATATGSIDDSNVPTLTDEAGDFNEAAESRVASSIATQASDIDSDRNSDNADSDDERSATEEPPRVANTQAEVEGQDEHTLTADPAVSEMEKSRKDENRVVH